MESESERLTAMHTIEQLNAELMMLKSSNAISPVSITGNAELTRDLENNNSPKVTRDGKVSLLPYFIF